uniref:lipoyl(octanoyl) transferase n=1 Tax=Populus trichocarpa TaxID=3694 RepID=A0A2K2BQS4_POPTR
MIFPRSLEVWKLGKVNYLEALKLQEKLVCDRKAYKIPDTLLSLQHPPTYTLGKRRTDHNLLIPVPELEKIGAELHYTQRGGDITYHGPHQAILYPIISLRDIGLGARKYVEKLELTMIDMASQYGVKACAGKKCETGVWVGDRKIGAIGVRISSGITSHGLAFNVDPDLDYFKHIVPCGIADKEVTSLRRETGMGALIFHGNKAYKKELHMLNSKAIRILTSLYRTFTALRGFGTLMSDSWLKKRTGALDGRIIL